MPVKGVLTTKPVGQVCKVLSRKIIDMGLSFPMLDYTRKDANLPEGVAGTIVCIFGIADNGQEVGAFVPLQFEEDLQIEGVQDFVIKAIREDMAFKGFIMEHQI